MRDELLDLQAGIQQGKPIRAKQHAETAMKSPPRDRMISMGVNFW